MQHSQQTGLTQTLCRTKDAFQSPNRHAEKQIQQASRKSRAGGGGGNGNRGGVGGGGAGEGGRRGGSGEQSHWTSNRGAGDAGTSERRAQTMAGQATDLFLQEGDSSRLLVCRGPDVVFFENGEAGEKDVTDSHQVRTVSCRQERPRAR